MSEEKVKRPRSKVTRKPPTIQQIAKAAQQEITITDVPIATMSGEPETTIETTSTKPTAPHLCELKEGRATPLSSPLVELHLRRVGPILTDSGETVRIPAPAIVPDGARVRVEIYREEG